MPRRWKQILCPVDVDADSTDALAVALDLAEQFKAAVYLLYVVATPMPGPSEPVPAWQRALNVRLEKLARDWFEGKVPYQVMVWSGDPAPAILRAAVDLNADLIVMATHGRRGMDRLILGSVAERVVRESPKPVLTVKPGPA